MSLRQRWVVACGLAGVVIACCVGVLQAKGTHTSDGFDASSFDLEAFLTADVGTQKQEDIKRLVVHRQLIFDKMEEDKSCAERGDWLGEQLETFSGSSTEDYLRLLCEVEPRCFKSFGSAFQRYFVEDLAQKPRPGKKEPYITMFEREVPFSQAINAAPVIAEYFCTALNDPLGLY